ncbi:MAG TPA: hypothetical protein VK716_00345 [Terracidiphilus sp.]|nr:hypothetical protein [Terracidiphilus sp.]
MLSALVRSAVYLVAMATLHHRNRLVIVLVELAYVTATAGVYAGAQQRALQIRSRAMGNLVIAFVVPGLAQFLDYFVHQCFGAAAPARATLAACIFTLVSALFHLHVMRRGVFLTGHRSRTLAEDFRNMSVLLMGFLRQPLVLVAGGVHAREAESEASV